MRITRRLAVGILLALASLAWGATSAFAYWTTAGTGTGSATTATLNPPTLVTATSTPGASSVVLNWSAPTSGVTPQGYRLTRITQPGGATAAACGGVTVTDTGCTDSGLTAGTYTWTVTAVSNSWTAVSVPSSPVSVVTDLVAPVVAVTHVNGSARIFPWTTNQVLSFGGTCSTGPGDILTVTPRLNGLATNPASVPCTSGTWSVMLASSFTTQGTVPLSATQSDAAGNVGTAPAAEVVIDTAPPTVASIARTGTSPTNSGPLTWTVTFSEPVSGVVASNFQLVTGGLTGTPLLGTPSASGAVPASIWTVAVGMSGVTAAAGSVALDLTVPVGITDLAGNVLATTATGPPYAYDTTPPTVSGVTSSPASGSYRAGSVITVSATFTEPITVTGTPKLTLATRPGGTPVDATAASGSTLDFRYTVAAGDTSPDLDYVSSSALALDGGAIRDAAGNSAQLTLASPGLLGSLGANSNVVIDTTAPVVTVATANGSTQLPGRTNQAVTKLGGTCGNAVGDGMISPTVDGSPTSPATTSCTGGTWTLNLATALTNGTYTLGATQSDLAGNTGAAPAVTLIVDTVRPTVSSIVRVGPTQLVNSGPLSWTVTFSEPVTGVAVSNFGLATSGIASGTPAISTVSAGPGGSPSATWTVSVPISGVTANGGSIGLNLANATGVKDAALNTLSTTSFTGQTYTLDNVGPAVTITRLSAVGGSGKIRVDGTGELGLPVTVSVCYSQGSAATPCATPTEVLTVPALTATTWQIQPTTRGAGWWIITASQTDAAGNTTSVTPAPFFN